MSQTQINAASQLGGNTAVNYVDFVATAGQTSFSISPSNFTGAVIETYVGGARLKLGDDYTVSGNNTVVLGTGVDAGVNVTVKWYTPALQIFSGFGGIKNVQILTSSSGTYTKTSGVTKIVYEMWGGGGGGGGAGNGGGGFGGSGGGGGGGGYIRKFVDASSITTLAYTVGGGGSGGSAGAGNGTFANSGGSTTFNGDTAGGGSGGENGGNGGGVSGGAGGAGGTAVGGLPGQTGQRGNNGTGSNPGASGQGGQAMMSSAGGLGIVATNTGGNIVGVSGFGYGGGGSGAQGAAGSASASGGSGTAGAIVVWEYA